MLLFSLDGATPVATALSAHLDEPLAPLEERAFLDGEHKLRPLVDPRGHDCHVLAALHGGPGLSPHDKLVRLLLFCATLQAHGAARVTAVLPYLAYARNARETQPFDPVATRTIAQLIEAVGVRQVITLEVHDVAAYQNAFRIPTQHAGVQSAFTEAVLSLVGAQPLVVASPDPGGVKRAQRWRETLREQLDREVGFAFIDRRRAAGVLSSLGLLAGDVRGATVLLLDDLIASGQTMVHAARTLRAAGAHAVHACAAHGLFVEPAATLLLDEAIDGLLVSDSVPPFRLPADSPLRRRLVVASCALGLAEAIRSGLIG